MQKGRASGAKGPVLGALAVVALFGFGGLVTVYTGAFDVAATEEHAAPVRWAFDTTFRKSVERRAADHSPPAQITSEMVASGASAYKSMCEHCHAGPGAKREDWAAGMRPQPPHLVEAAAEWEINEVFWIVKHGVKMSGMPAFGPSHDDAALWSIAAFVRELPAMTPERYASLGSAAEHAKAHAAGHGGEHGHGHGDSHGAGQPGQSR